MLTLTSLTAPQTSRKLAMEIFITGCLCHTGESSIHIAIVYGDLEMVKMLVEAGADVHQRASGRFFLPEDQKESNEPKEAKMDPNDTNYQGRRKLCKTWIVVHSGETC